MALSLLSGENMWARISGGIVVELSITDPSNRFHPTLEWVACDAAVKVGWSWDGERCAPAMAAGSDPLSRVELEHARLRAYADPITGSDRYFAEAQREALLSNSEAAEQAKLQGLRRFAEIQAEYPWPIV